MQAWDFKAGNNFILKMQEAIKETARSIIVLSQNYLSSEYCQPKWAAVFNKGPTGEKGLLIPVRISDVIPTGLLSTIIYIDLYGEDENGAIKKLLYGVGKSNNLRKKPKFPNLKRSFPGK